MLIKGQRFVLNISHAGREYDVRPDLFKNGTKCRACCFSKGGKDVRNLKLFLESKRTSNK